MKNFFMKIISIFLSIFINILREIKNFLLFSQNFAVFAKTGPLGLILLMRQKNCQDIARLTMMRDLQSQV